MTMNSKNSRIPFGGVVLLLEIIKYVQLVFWTLIVLFVDQMYFSFKGGLTHNPFQVLAKS